MAAAKENPAGVATTIRVPEHLLEKIRALAAEIGDSQNGVMLHLMFMGMSMRAMSRSVWVLLKILDQSPLDEICQLRVDRTVLGLCDLFDQAVHFVIQPKAENCGVSRLFEVITV